MFGILWICAYVFSAVAGQTGAAAPPDSGARKATYSLEAAIVNDIPLAGGPVSRVSVSPGDTVLAKFFFRDWSPSGQSMRAYQISLKPEGYMSGTRGHVKPVRFDETTALEQANNDNGFVDANDPTFVHKGIQTLALTDTISQGYRWMSVSLTGEGQKSPQDGTKFYCGTVKLRVSDDALGTFTFELDSHPEMTAARDTNDYPIELELEPLLIEVPDGTPRARIVRSEPPDGAIDARAPSKSPKDPPGGLSSIDIVLSSAAPVAAEEFAVTDGTQSAPKVRRVAGKDVNLRIELDRGLNPGVWTEIRHVPSGTSTRIGCLPGDVNNDGFCDPADAGALIESMNGRTKLPPYRSDVDRDGKVTSKDVMKLIDLISGTSPYGNRLPPRK